MCISNTHYIDLSFIQIEGKSTNTKMKKQNEDKNLVGSTHQSLNQQSVSCSCQKNGQREMVNLIKDQGQIMCTKMHILLSNFMSKGASMTMWIITRAFELYVWILVCSNTLVPNILSFTWVLANPTLYLLLPSCLSNMVAFSFISWFTSTTTLQKPL